MTIEICWIHNLLLELGHPPKSEHTSLVYSDNVRTIYMSTNPIQHKMTKHIGIDIHLMREKVQHGQVSILHDPSHYQLVDMHIH